MASPPSTQAQEISSLPPHLTEAEEKLASLDSPSSRPLFSNSKRFPPELFYHVIEHTTRPTNLSLCLVSTSVRAIASPRLYESMSVISPSQLMPFVSDPLATLAPPDLSLTLGKVLSLELSLTDDTELASLYPALSLPRLLHLSLRFTGNPYTDEELPALPSNFLNHLNPYSLSISSRAPWVPPWTPIFVHSSNWLASTSTWTRLNSINFTGTFWLYLHSAIQLQDPIPLNPSDLPGSASSIALSWTFTDPRERYRSARGSVLEDVINCLSLATWPGVATSGIQFNIGVDEEDRATLKRDLQGLPEEWEDWKSLVHY